MKGKAETGEVVIGRRTVERWTGMRKAARLLGVSDTQVRRHVTGTQPSQRLARKMRELGIHVATQMCEQGVPAGGAQIVAEHGTAERRGA